MRALLLPLAVAACTPTAPSCPHGLAPMLEYRLYFGRSSVSDQQWAEFTQQVVTAHLPDGFTAIDADGQWMNPDTHRISRERSKVIVVAVPDTPASAAAITAIKDDYRARFAQKSVGVTVAPVCGAF
jgi:hypothetical protein